MKKSCNDVINNFPLTGLCLETMSSSQSIITFPACAKNYPSHTSCQSYFWKKRKRKSKKRRVLRSNFWAVRLSGHRKCQALEVILIRRFFMVKWPITSVDNTRHLSLCESGYLLYWLQACPLQRVQQRAGAALYTQMWYAYSEMETRTLNFCSSSYCTACPFL